MSLTGEADEVPDFDVSGTTVGEWSIVIYNHPMEDFARYGGMEALSAGREAMLVHVNETTMFQWAQLWRDGREVWAIRHEGDADHRHLEATGELPAFYEDLRAARLAEQDEEDAGESEVDYVSEIPLDAAERVTGFRHDQGAEEFVELSRPTR